MEKLKYIAALTGHIFRTVAGLYLYPYSNTWDHELQQLMDEGTLIAVDEYTAIFHHNNNIVEIWVASRWYGYAWLNRFNGFTARADTKCTRPRFRTMYRLHQKVQAYLAEGTRL